MTEVVRTWVPVDSVEEQWDLPTLEKTLREEWQLEVSLAAEVEKSDSITDDDIVEKVVAAADAHFKLGFKLGFAVQGADDLVLVHHGIAVIFLDVTGGDGAFLVGKDGKEAGLLGIAVVLETHLLEVQDDLNDVFEHDREGGEFVFRTADFHGSDGCAFKGGEKDAAEGVANCVTVTFVEGFGDELGVGVGGRGLVFHEAIRHFESSETC